MTAETAIKCVFLGIVALIWLYIATRMITRGIMRSIEEWRKRNG